LIDVKITGDVEIKRKLDLGLNAQLNKSLKVLATRARLKLTAAVPAITHNLRGRVNFYIKDLSAYVGTSLYYGRFVEKGTSKMEPRYNSGGTRVPGTGPAAHTSEVMSSEIREFEQEVIREAESIL